MSHQPDAPWSHTAQSGEIPRQAIQAYFSKQEPLPSFDDLLDGYPVEVL